MQIKKIISAVLICTILLTLAACGSSGSSTSSQTQPQTIETSETDHNTEVSADYTEVSTDNTEESEDNIEEPVDAEKKNDKIENESGTISPDKNDTLIIYFSANNRKSSDVDAVTSATPVTDGKSSVAQMAEIIQETVGGDIVQIIPSEDYPLAYDDVADQAKQERDANIRPAFEELGVDPASYKTVFIGYPIWWYQMPMIMETLFDTYDFSGVTIVPFNTHEGSRDGGTYDMIRDREPDATVLDGLAIRGSDVSDASRDDIQKWLDGLDLD